MANVEELRRRRERETEAELRDAALTVSAYLCRNRDGRAYLASRGDGGVKAALGALLDASDAYVAAHAGAGDARADRGAR